MNKKDSVEIQKTSTAYLILEEISVFLKYLNIDNNFVIDLVILMAKKYQIRNDQLFTILEK